MRTSKGALKTYEELMPKLSSILAAAAVAVSALAAAAEEYPSRPVRVICPVPPAGLVDNATRVVTERLHGRLGQNVVIDNRPGANGALGAQIVAQSAPDGYTLLSAVDGTMVVSLNGQIPIKKPVETLRDLIPVTKLGDAALLLVANPSVPAKNLAEFIKVAKAKGDVYPFGTSGIGSTTHLSGELLAQRAGIKLQHVPYKGGGQALTDVLGGQIPLVFTTVATAQQHVKSGKLIALGVPGAKRSSALADTPTFIESGLKGFDVSGWVGVFAPAKTPRAVINRMQQAIAEVLAEPAVKARYETFGVEPVGNSADRFAEQIKADLALWAKVVKDGNITLE
jgi:tripartite-type tricarboxylate transporter receptor subunit TctC